jgi:hypothetical protein
MEHVAVVLIDWSIWQLLTSFAWSKIDTFSGVSFATGVMRHFTLKISVLRES